MAVSRCLPSGLFVGGLLLLSLAGVADGTCPNGCSGHGSCSKGDSCQCFKSHTGNDCSQRLCPYNVAFTTTPQGDVNHDGVQDDNANKLVVSGTEGKPNYADVPASSNIINFQTDIDYGELTVGDAVRLGEETFFVTGWTNLPAGNGPYTHKNDIVLNSPYSPGLRKGKVYVSPPLSRNPTVVVFTRRKGRTKMIPPLSRCFPVSLPVLNFGRWRCTCLPNPTIYI